MAADTDAREPPDGAAPAPDAAPAPPADGESAGANADSLAARSAELRRLAHDLRAYAAALGELALSEAALAKLNFTRLLLLALAIPAIVFGILLGIDALIAAFVARLAGDWTLAVASVLVLNAALLGATLLLLRRWWRSLSLPRSRAALARAFEVFR